MSEFEATGEGGSREGPAAMPWRLRAISLLFIFLGIMGTLDMGVWLLKDSAKFDIGSPLLIWLGIRLLQRSEGARPWAVFVSWMLVIGCAVAFALWAVDLILLTGGHAPITNYPSIHRWKTAIPLPLWIVPLIVTPFLLLFAWVLLCLRSFRRKCIFIHPPPNARLDTRSRKHVIAVLVAAVACTIGREVAVMGIPCALRRNLGRVLG